MPVPAPAPYRVAQALAAGTTPTAALRAYRAEGGHISTQSWYRLYGQAQVEGLHVSDEATRPLNRIPTSDEISELAVKVPGGFIHRILVFGRDEEGVVHSKNISLKVRAPMSRGRAISTAIAIVQGSLKDYGITPIGGSHVGTHRLV